MYKLLIASILLVAVAAGSRLAAQKGGSPQAAVPSHTRQPGGKLSDHLGVALTIEGVRAEQGKVGVRTLIVDKLNGRRLTKPVPVWVDNLELPRGRRCVLRGYESGRMIGTPPAYADWARKRGDRFAELTQAGWQWAPYFVVLEVEAPEGLKLPERSSH